MKNVKIDLKQIFLYLGMMLLVVNLSSCSDDDDAVITPVPTGTFALAADEYTVTDNTITLESINVDQTTWLTAVHSGSANTNDFIAEPVRLQQGNNTDVDLVFDEGAITDAEDGHEVVLRLYADNGSTTGSWDATDQALTNTETITVYAEDEGTMSFADFDTNADGTLDADEIQATYQNNFTEWDADEDGFLNSEEFYNTTFGNTDADDDDAISEEEWNAGFAGMYGAWSDDDFATFDADASGDLSRDEWNAVFAESEWFTTYDADASTSISEDEWNAGLFADWDTDASGTIDEDEYNVYSPYAMGW